MTVLKAQREITKIKKKNKPKTSEGGTALNQLFRQRVENNAAMWERQQCLPSTVLTQL